MHSPVQSNANRKYNMQKIRNMLTRSPAKNWPSSLQILKLKGTQPGCVADDKFIRLVKHCIH